MLKCKLCDNELSRRDVRRDGSILCPVCGQVYWKEAVEKALQESSDSQLEYKKKKRWHRSCI